MSRDAGGTIVGLASPPGPGRRGIVRVSGPDAWSLVEAVWRGETPLPERPHRAFALGRLDDGAGEQPLLLLWMPGPRSFTREDVAELHLPGSPPLLDRALSRLLELGARMARPGEFTRRAFENGRIDLTRAEGVLALVSARSAAEVRGARALLEGGLGRRIETLREGLDALRALCEASLDFEESDTGDVPIAELLERGRRVLEGVREAERWESRRAPEPGLPRVVLLGEPNAGKSSLFNALVVGGEALVSDVPGTTRDALAAVWTLPGGAAVRLFDTAGEDRGASGVDARAQERAERLFESADLLLWVVDATEAHAARHAAAALARAGGDVPLVLSWNKSDLSAARPAPELGAGLAPVPTSATARLGLDALALEVERRLGASGEGGPAAGLGRELSARHRAALRHAADALEKGLDAARGGLPLDLFAEVLRAATAELDSISGRTTSEDLLDRIFGAFCIGK